MTALPPDYLQLDLHLYSSFYCDDDMRRVRAVEAMSAVVMPIVYEYLRRNDYNLQGLLKRRLTTIDEAAV